jgi:DNA-binding XRE family transcriptional regulator
MAADVAAYDAVMERLTAGETELVPLEMTKRLLSGENPLRVWREYRGLTVKDVAKKAGIAAAYLSQIETGKREGTLETLRRLAKALSVTLDELAP